MKPKTYSITEARTRFARIASDAQAGDASVITRYGIPIAVVVCVEKWQAQQPSFPPNAGMLSLRGTGKGLWSDHPVNAVSKLRDEWSTRVSKDQIPSL